MKENGKRLRFLIISVLAPVLILAAGCTVDGEGAVTPGIDSRLVESLRQASADSTSTPAPDGEGTASPLLTSYPGPATRVAAYPAPVETQARTPARVFLPLIGGSSGADAPTGTPTPSSSDTATSKPDPTATLTPIPTPTRRPLRPTKLGIGVYTSGGANFIPMDKARPSIILLMDPNIDFAQDVRKMFPNAFIVGRRYVAHQPLDNPAERGRAFADEVAKWAVPLKGVVDAWMSYNEVTGHRNVESYVAYNIFQTEFARRLQDHHGISAVAGNDASATVGIDEYATYFAEAISISHYFGLHAYSPPEARSFREPAGQELMLRYRRIKADLDRAGVKHGPFVFTEVGLWDGFRGVAEESEMVEDFIWLAEEMNKDDYVKGFMVFGLFNHDNERWYNFNINTPGMLDRIGEYNTEPLREEETPSPENGG